MQTIDLRSDTVTLPSPAMREAMSKAAVGDDVYREDPTVNELEAQSAALLGKEAGLFVASGTMGNLLAILTQCGRGEQIIVGDQYHSAKYERGGCAALGGVFASLIPVNVDGTIPVERIESAVMPEDPHFGRAKLVCLENTYHGRVIPKSYLDQVADVARRKNLKLHLDGARLFNASVASNMSVAEITEHFDSVQFCFSKGLAAPVGSMLCGSKDFVEEARNLRKMIGGGMRQAGVIASACRFALDNMVQRLQDDHDNADALAEALRNLGGLNVDHVETNMLFVSPADSRVTAQQLVSKLKEQGLLVLALNDRMIRIVMHYGIERADVQRATKIFQSCLELSLA